MGIALRLDPWPADYDAAIQIESLEEKAPDRVDGEVETREWRALQPESAPRPGMVCFLDGVRRVEARVLADVGGRLLYGAFASAAVGAVTVANGEARLGPVSVRRFLILGCGIEQSLGVRIGADEALFEGFPAAGKSPKDIVGELQNLMRSEEAALGERIASSGARVFADGPLSYFSLARHELVGVIKSIHEPYLDASRFAIVPRLGTGQRTPLFAIADSKYDRYSCFLRLAPPGPVDHALAGVVRVEIRAAVGLEKARTLADFSAAELPRFASHAAREARAPQNLLPVGALEQELRRRLGDPILLRRAIERHLSEAAA